MNARQKRFILEKLIPFILREQGRGFAMSTWVTKEKPGTEITDLDVDYRKVPGCGAICCIGGSIQMLRGIRNRHNQKEIMNAIGLTKDQMNGLFYQWDGFGVDGTDGRIYGWPAEFAERFENAKTPYRKAQAAVALLKEIVKTNGECLKIG